MGLGLGVPLPPGGGGGGGGGSQPKEATKMRVASSVRAGVAVRAGWGSTHWTQAGGRTATRADTRSRRGTCAWSKCPLHTLDLDIRSYFLYSDIWSMAQIGEWVYHLGHRPCIGVGNEILCASFLFLDLR